MSLFADKLVSAMLTGTSRNYKLVAPQEIPVHAIRVSTSSSRPVRAARPASHCYKCGQDGHVDRYCRYR